MRHDAFKRAIKRLEGLDVVVAFSGGKESLVVLDLARRVCNKAEAFCMELVPGIACFEEHIKRAEDRYGMEIIRYPHWQRADFMNLGVYRRAKAIGYNIGLQDIFKLARYETGISVVATGMKKADSARRASRAAEYDAPQNGIISPLWDWGTRDVLGYLAANKIPRPGGDGRRSTGIDLSHECICWLYDCHREDYEKIRAEFPYVEAIILRRKFYGIGERYGAAAVTPDGDE